MHTFTKARSEASGCSAVMASAQLGAMKHLMLVPKSVTVRLASEELLKPCNLQNLSLRISHFALPLDSMLMLLPH